MLHWWIVHQIILVFVLLKGNMLTGYVCTREIVTYFADVLCLGCCTGWNIYWLCTDQYNNFVIFTGF